MPWGGQRFERVRVVHGLQFRGAGRRQALAAIHSEAPRLSSLATANGCSAVPSAGGFAGVDWVCFGVSLGVGTPKHL